QADCLDGYTCSAAQTCVANRGSGEPDAPMPSTPSVTATGTLGAIPLVLKSTAATIEQKNGDSFLLIYLSPFYDACTATSVNGAGDTAIEMALYKMGPGSTYVAATEPGVYSTSAIGSAGPYVEIDTFARNASCGPVDGEGKGTGTVTLTQSDAGIYS